MEYDSLFEKQLSIRRRLWLLAALVCSVLFCLLPMLSFIPDEGIQYTRSFVSHPFRVVMLQTDQTTGTIVSIETLHLYGLMAVELALVVTLLFATFMRNTLSVLSAINAAKILSVLFYVVLFAYLVFISDSFFATVRPTWTLVLPVVMYLCCSRARFFVPDDTESRYY